MNSSFTATIPVSSLKTRALMAFLASSWLEASITSTPARRKPGAVSGSVTTRNLYMDELLPDDLLGHIRHLEPGNDPDIRYLGELCPHIADGYGDGEGISKEPAGSLPDQEPLQLLLKNRDLLLLEGLLGNLAEEFIRRARKLFQGILDGPCLHEHREPLNLQGTTGDQELLRVLEGNPVADHLQHRTEIGHIDLGRNHLPHTAIIIGLATKGFEGILKVELVKGVLHHREIPLITEILEVPGQWHRVRDPPGGQKIDDAPDVRLLDEFYQGRLVEFPGGDEAPQDLR